MLSTPQTKHFSQSHLLILFNVQLSSECVLKQEIKPKYEVCLKLRHFIEKSSKSPSAGALSLDPLRLRRLGGPAPHPPITLFPYEFLPSRLFLTAAVVTDINYCKLGCHRLCMTFWNHLFFGKFDGGGPSNFIFEGREASNGLDSALSSTSAYDQKSKINENSIKSTSLSIISANTSLG